MRSGGAVTLPACLILGLLVLLTEVAGKGPGGADGDYCRSSCGRQHTMCRFSSRRVSAGCGRDARQGIAVADKLEILEAHNRIRRDVRAGVYADRNLPAAASMPDLTWDAELAEIAQRWANQCQMGHDQCRNVKRFYVGQNAAWTWGSRKDWTKSAIGGWFHAELPYFRQRDLIYRQGRDPASGKQIGHLTQVVWAETRMVGCGYTEAQEGNWVKRSYFCNYGPGGNVVGEPMYEVGSPGKVPRSGGKKRGYQGKERGRQDRPGRRREYEKDRRDRERDRRDWRREREDRLPKGRREEDRRPRRRPARPYRPERPRGKRPDGRREPIDRQERRDREEERRRRYRPKDRGYEGREEERYQPRRRKDQRPSDKREPRIYPIYPGGRSPRTKRPTYRKDPRRPSKRPIYRRDRRRPSKRPPYRRDRRRPQERRRGPGVVVIERKFGGRGGGRVTGSSQAGGVIRTVVNTGLGAPDPNDFVKNIIEEAKQKTRSFAGVVIDGRAIGPNGGPGVIRGRRGQEEVDPKQPGGTDGMSIEEEAERFFQDGRQQQQRRPRRRQERWRRRGERRRRRRKPGGAEWLGGGPRAWLRPQSGRERRRYGSNGFAMFGRITEKPNNATDTDKGAGSKKAMK